MIDIVVEKLFRNSNDRNATSAAATLSTKLRQLSTSAFRSWTYAGLLNLSLVSRMFDMKHVLSSFVVKDSKEKSSL